MVEGVHLRMCLRDIVRPSKVERVEIGLIESDPNWNSISIVG
jgi:hypothetical protein